MSRIGPGKHDVIIPGLIGSSTTTRTQINGKATHCVSFLSLTSVLLQLGSQSASCGIVHSPSPTLITVSPTRCENDRSDCASAIIRTHWRMHMQPASTAKKEKPLHNHPSAPGQAAASCRLKLMLALIAP